MIKIIFLIPTLILTSCSTTPRCGDPIDARVVYVQKNSCEVRIRQVTIGSNLKLPESLKGSRLVSSELQWVEPGLVAGQVELGHFVIAPKEEGERQRP